MEELRTPKPILFDAAGRIMFHSTATSSLAAHLGLSRQYVSKLRNGKAPIPPSLWPDLLRLVEQKVAELHRWHDRLANCLKRYELAKAEGIEPARLGLGGRDFAEIGKAMFGERWTSAMAEELGMSPEYMRRLSKGKRSISSDLWRRINSVCVLHTRRVEYIECRLGEFEYRDEVACDWATDNPRRARFHLRLVIEATVH